MDKLDVAFERLCRIAAKSPEFEELAKGIILMADHMRQLELELRALQVRASKVLEQAYRVANEDTVRA